MPSERRVGAVWSFDRPLLASGLIAALLLTLAGCGNSGDGQPSGNAGRFAQVGLVTSLPIYWREAEDISGLLTDQRPPHWALGVLGELGQVTPLDTLSGPDGTVPLGGDALLVMAQPYPLSPQENVALDDWVRDGGRVLLFADPMLTGESDYALGDRRRPQDVALLSPILARWGLDLLFDEAQPAGEREVAALGTQVPVNLSGAFAQRAGSRGCALDAQGLVATCRVGRGVVLAVADAALLEEPLSEGSQSESVERVDVRVRALRRILLQIP